jgi:hypothetical protein
MFEDQLLELIAELLGDPELQQVIEYCESLTDDQVKLISAMADDLIATDLPRSEAADELRRILRGA